MGPCAARDPRLESGADDTRRDHVILALGFIPGQPWAGRQDILMKANARAKRRRILFLTPQLPYPPEQGTAIRNYNLIVEVAKHHDVALLSFAGDDQVAVDLGLLTKVCSPLRTVPVPMRSMRDRLRTLLTTCAPDMAHRLRSSAYVAALKDLLAEETFDLLQIEGIELAPYGLMVQEWLGEKTPAIVFDDHNAEYVLQRRAFETDVQRLRRWPAALYSLIQWHRLQHFECRVCSRADATIAVSEADARAIERIAPGVRPLTVPNGVDVERYHPGLADSLPLKHPAIVFTAKMDYRPNVDAMLWFHRHVWPLVRSRRPDARFYVVGKSPHPRLAPLMDDPSVTVTGYVADILPYFGGADLYVAPFRIGGGTRLKVLEALAAGLPLVGTTLGVEGIDLVSGQHALLADEPDAFAEAILSLLHDHELRLALGAAARQFVLDRYDWRRIVPRLDPLYASL